MLLLSLKTLQSQPLTLISVTVKVSNPTPETTSIAFTHSVYPQCTSFYFTTHSAKVQSLSTTVSLYQV
ncbi:hypothetical protein EB796_024949 [Bugula neritina]|uniref:Uncharacterized protein n=1 Tax=Bugula neritina TaxID=10212 RepID=A0A7J7ITK5_BUGNE|nr:hypothetical protein EB796_024949 [Bugula neritina]